MKTTRTLETHRIGAVIDAIAKLNKRSEKLGLATITVTIGETRMVRTQCKHTGRSYPESHTTVTITGESPQLNGWSFVALIEHCEHGNVIYAAPDNDRDLAGYRAFESNCDHCNLKRIRNDTFLVARNNELRQVGRTCLRDFLGHKSIDAIVSYAALVQSVHGVLDGDEDFGKAPSTIGTVEYLSWVAQSIEQSGWVPKSRSAPECGIEATCDDAYMSWCEFGRREHIEHPTSEHVKIAESAIAQVSTLSGSLNDYEHNIKTVALSTIVSDRARGFAACIVAYHLQSVERAAMESAKADRPSEHVGAVGDKIEFTATVVSVRRFENVYNVSFLYKMISDGNILVWFTSSNPEFEIGKSYNLKATVKEHSEFRGEKQTRILRCKVASPKKAKKSKKAA